MTDLTAMYAEVMSKRLVPTSKPGSSKGALFTYVDDFQKLEQAIGNAVYTAAYALGNPVNVEKLSSAINTSVTRRFYPYVNMTAHRDRRAYWHLYDGNHIGDSRYALFKFNTKKTGASRFNMGLVFKPAKIMTPITATQATPGPSGKSVKKGHVFYNKAMVMEYGIPTTIKPKGGGYLAFDIQGRMIFTQKTIVINRSGSPTVGSLRGLANRFFIDGPGNSAVSRVADRYAEEANRLAGDAVHYAVDVHMASDSKAKSVASQLGRMVGDLDV